MCGYGTYVDILLDVRCECVRDGGTECVDVEFDIDW
jgi:hypothetical protein